jgi:two-component system NtrC family response regulator
MGNILIVDDDRALCTALEKVMARMGHTGRSAHSLEQGLRLARDQGPQVVVLDVWLPDGNGLEALSRFRESPSEPEVIILTGSGDPDGAELAIRSGAWSYITKPPTLNKIKLPVQRAVEHHQRKTQRVPVALERSGIIGRSRALTKCLDTVAQAAASEASVLVEGETGTGKELFARAIHDNSLRKDGPFVVVDCAALPEKLVESTLFGHAKGAFTGADKRFDGLVLQAHQGTLFLDEVGELPMDAQRVFLRVLQEKRFRPVGVTREVSSDFRLVAATNRDLEAMTRAGTFRPDLLFRLRTLEIPLPPLRDRDRDVTLLAEHFSQAASDRYRLSRKRLSKQFAKVVTAYTWPGNVRELGNVMEAAVIAAGHEPVIYPKHLPGNVRVSTLDKGKPRKQQSKPTAPPSDAPIQSYADYKSMRDRAYFQQLMDLCDFDIPRASRLSGLSIPSIYRHLALAGIPTRSAK